MLNAFQIKAGHCTVLNESQGSFKHYNLQCTDKDKESSLKCLRTSVSSKYIKIKHRIDSVTILNVVMYGWLFIRKQ